MNKRKLLIELASFLKKHDMHIGCYSRLENDEPTHIIVISTKDDFVRIEDVNFLDSDLIEFVLESKYQEV